MAISPTRLLIVRHGNTFNPNEEARRVGKTDLPLVASGEEQARRLGTYLVSYGLVPDMAYSSTLQRTIRTAEIIRETTKANFHISPRALFDEVDYGEDENKPEAEVVFRLGEQALKLWDEQAVVPDGWKIDTHAFREGWQTFAAEIAQQWPGKTVLVVTSNGVARFMPIITGDVERFHGTHSLKLRTGTLCVFEHAGDVWECREWGRAV